MSIIESLTQTFWLSVPNEEAKLMYGSTFITPPCNAGGQELPVVETVNEKGPATVGVPVMVTTPPLTLYETPGGIPETKAPVAVPPKVYTTVSIGLFTQTT